MLPASTHLARIFSLPFRLPIIRRLASCGLFQLCKFLVDIFPLFRKLVDGVLLQLFSFLHSFNCTLCDGIRVVHISSEMYLTECQLDDTTFAARVMYGAL